MSVFSFDAKFSDFASDNEETQVHLLENKKAGREARLKKVSNFDKQKDYSLSMILLLPNRR